MPAMSSLRVKKRIDYSILHNGESLPQEKPQKIRQILPDEYTIDRIITTKKCPNEVCIFHILFFFQESRDLAKFLLYRMYGQRLSEFLILVSNGKI